MRRIHQGGIILVIIIGVSAEAERVGAQADYLHRQKEGVTLGRVLLIAHIAKSTIGCDSAMEAGAQEEYLHWRCC